MRPGAIVYVIWNNFIIVNYLFWEGYKVVEAFFFFFEDRKESKLKAFQFLWHFHAGQCSDFM